MFSATLLNRRILSVIESLTEMSKAASVFIDNPDDDTLHDLSEIIEEYHEESKVMLDALTTILTDMDTPESEDLEIEVKGDEDNGFELS